MVAGHSLQPLLLLILLGADSENLIKDPLDNPHCGAVPRRQPVQTRMIVGGNEAQPDAWPWQIAVLNRKNQLICGGTLISSEFVLTAAHCVTANLRIVAGEYDLAELDGEFRQERFVARSFKHPQYHKKNVDNDIALLKLDRPLQLSTKVWPACLPEQGDELEPQTNGTILGWGVTLYESQPNGKPLIERDDMLREARVPVVDFEECNRNYGGNLTSHQVVCAGYEEGQIDSCAGDSGGPLLVERDNRWHVFGVTSFGDECGKEGKFGIYSKTSAYVNWINRVVLKHSTSRVSV